MGLETNLIKTGTTDDNVGSITTHGILMNILQIQQLLWYSFSNAKLDYLNSVICQHFSEKTYTNIPLPQQMLEDEDDCKGIEL